LINGSKENKTIQTSSIHPIRNLQTTPIAFRLGIEEISLYKPSNLAASQRAYFTDHKTSPTASVTSTKRITRQKKQEEKKSVL